MLALWLSGRDGGLRGLFGADWELGLAAKVEAERKRRAFRRVQQLGVTTRVGLYFLVRGFRCKSCEVGGFQDKFKRAIVGVGREM